MKKNRIASWVRRYLTSAPSGSMQGAPHEGMVLGLDRETQSPLTLDVGEVNRSTNVLITGHYVDRIAIVRSLRRQQIDRGGALICIANDDGDSLSDFLSAAAQANRLSDVLVINLDHPEESHTYNSLMEGTPDVVAEKILQLLPASESSVGSDYYRQTARHVLITLIRALHRADRLFNALDLSILCINEGALTQLQSELQDLISDTLELDQFMTMLDLFRNGDKQLDAKKLRGLLGGIGGRLWILGNNKMGGIVNAYNPQLQLCDAVTSGKLVYFIARPYSASFASTNQKVIFHFLTDLSEAIVRLNKLPGRQCLPWQISIEEVGFFAHHIGLADLAEFGPSVGAYLVASTEELCCGQHHVYDVLLSHTACRIACRPRSLEHASPVAEQLISSWRSNHIGDQGQSSVDKATQKSYARHEEAVQKVGTQLLGLKPGHALIGRLGQPIGKLQRMDSPGISHFVNFSDLNPVSTMVNRGKGLELFYKWAP